MLINCRHICIVSNNLEESLYFYTKILGLHIIKRRLEKDDYVKTLLNNEIDEVEYIKLGINKKDIPILELYYFNKNKYIIPVVNTFHHISFTVKNINRLYKKLHQKNYIPLSRPLIDPCKENYVMFTKDPDNNLIEFVEPIKRRK